MIEPKHPTLSVVRQCELLELPRASYYRQPKPENDENLELMRVIDETYLAHPFFGSRQMRDWLRLQGYRINRKRVQRLMRQLRQQQRRKRHRRRQQPRHCRIAMPHSLPLPFRSNSECTGQIFSDIMKHDSICCRAFLHICFP